MKPTGAGNADQGATASGKHQFGVAHFYLCATRKADREWEKWPLPQQVVHVRKGKHVDTPLATVGQTAIAPRKLEKCNIENSTLAAELKPIPAVLSIR
jgi:hypothetical protein